MKPVIRRLLAGLFALTLATDATAGAPAPLANPAIDLWNVGTVNALVRLADGSVILGGDFTTVFDPVSQINLDRYGLAKFKPDGSLDLEWNPGVTCILSSGCVNALALEAGGTLIVAGEFISIGGVARNRLARVGTTGAGAVDGTWNPDADGGVYALALGPAGEVYAGGSFGNVGGLPRAGIAKLFKAGTGAADPAWNADLSGGDPFFTVFALAVDGSNNVYAGGSFDFAGEFIRSGLARLGPGGAVDPLWIPSTNSAVVLGLLLHDGALFVGGSFSLMGASTRYGLAKVALTGTGLADSNWNPATEPGTVIQSFSVQGSSMLVGGDFPVLGGLARTALAKVSTTGTGSGDPGFDANPIECAYAEFSCVNAVLLDATGAAYAGGGFASIDGQLSPAIARLDATGARLPAPFAQGVGTVTEIAAAPDGSAFVAGTFVRANAQFRGNLLKLTPSRTLDPDWNPAPDGPVRDLTLDSSGRPIVAGDFQRIGGLARTRLARLAATGTGAADAQWDPAPSSLVLAVAAGPAGVVYAGGLFSTIGGVPVPRLAKLSATGVVDLSWLPIPSSTVQQLAVDPATAAVYVGGTFSFIGAQSRSGLAKIDGSGSGLADAAWNPAPNGEVRAFAFDGSGKVYVTGAFTSIGAQSRNYIAKLSTSGTGTADSGWNALVPTGFLRPNSVAIDPLGAVLVGGRFDTIGGQARQAIAKLSPATGLADPGFDPGAAFDVNVLAALSDGTVLVGGPFTTIGGEPRRNLAALASFQNSIFGDGYE